MNLRSIRTLVAMAGLVASAASCSSAGPRGAERLNQDGNRSYSAGDYSSALETYRRAEVLRPDLPAINYNAANALNRQSDFKRALGEDQQAVHSTDPDVQARAYYGMGDAFVRTNQLREALDAYKSALRVNPGDLDAKYNLEVIQRRLNQDQARQDQQSQASQSSGADQTQAAGQPDGSEAAGPAQSGQAGAEQSGQSGQGSPSDSNSGASGYTGTPAGQAQALDPDLKRALDQFNRTGNIDDALRALDIVGHQERLRQAGGGDPSQPQGRGW